MDDNSQARGGRFGRSGGVPNYRNNIIIGIVEVYLPQGLEAWREVALVYQRESMEVTLCRGEDLWDNWNRKLCKRMQKPTCEPGVLSDRIYWCMEIEHHIQDEANVAILGADLAESGHSRNNDGSAFLEVLEDIAFGDVGNDGDEEDEEVTAVYAVDENAAAVAMVPSRPQSLPAFVIGNECRVARICCTWGQSV